MPVVFTTRARCIGMSLRYSATVLHLP